MSQRLTWRWLLAPFWKPCTFACVPARLYSICFRPSVALRYSSRWKGLHVSTSGWTVFLFLRLPRDCIFFPGKAHAANSRSASSSLVRMDWFWWGKPLRKWTNREIAFVFCFGLPSVWESSTKTNNPSISFMYLVLSLLFAHIGAKLQLFPYHKGHSHWMRSQVEPKCYMMTYPSVLRSPSVLRVWAAIPSEYMALSQTFSVTAHVELRWPELRDGPRAPCFNCTAVILVLMSNLEGN